MLMPDPASQLRPLHRPLEVGGVAIVPPLVLLLAVLVLTALAGVAIQRVGLVVDVGDEQIRETVAVEIAGVDPHARARLAFGAEGHTRLETPWLDIRYGSYEALPWRPTGPRPAGATLEPWPPGKG